MDRRKRQTVLGYEGPSGRSSRLPAMSRASRRSTLRPVIDPTTVRRDGRSVTNSHGTEVDVWSNMLVRDEDSRRMRRSMNDTRGDPPGDPTRMTLYEPDASGDPTRMTLYEPDASDHPTVTVPAPLASIQHDQWEAENREFITPCIDLFDDMMTLCVGEW